MEDKVKWLLNWVGSAVLLGMTGCGTDTASERAAEMELGDAMGGSRDASVTAGGPPDGDRGEDAAGRDVDDGSGTDGQGDGAGMVTRRDAGPGSMAIGDGGDPDDDPADPSPWDAGFDGGVVDAAVPGASSAYAGPWEDETGRFRVEVSGDGTRATVHRIAWTADVVAQGCSYTSESRAQFLRDNAAPVVDDGFRLELPERSSGFVGTIAGDFVDEGTLALMVAGESRETAACPPRERLAVPVASEAVLTPVVGE